MYEYRTDKINDSLILKQITDGILFGTDALALADFITEEKLGSFPTAAELGAGSGVISLLLASRGKAKKIYAVEILEDYAALCRENVRLNGFTEKIEVIQGDIKTPDEFFSGSGRLLPHSLDAVFTNPPYMQANVGKECKTDYKTIAKREILCTAADVARCAARLLKNKGAFYCVYRPARLAVLFAALSSCGLTPKKLRFIFDKDSSSPCLFLVKALLGAGEGLIIDSVRI